MNMNNLNLISKDELNLSFDEFDSIELVYALNRRLRHSSSIEFRLCERKFYLNNLTAQISFQTNIDLCFGASVGSAVQMLWLTNGDLDAAIFEIFKTWDIPFAEEKTSVKKSIAHAVFAIQQFVPIYSILSKEWELATFKGVPCVEFAMLLEFPNGFKYRCHADLILKHKETGEIAVWELKSTGAKWEHEAHYKNSDQGTPYALIADQINPDVKDHLWIYYPVYYSDKLEWIIYPFTKTLLHKTRWIKTMLRDNKDIVRCEEEDYWPMRGNSCMAFGRPCKYFDMCQLGDNAFISSQENLKEKLRKEEDEKYSFVIPLEKIIENYIGE